jgi:hypothetical protein
MAQTASGAGTGSAPRRRVHQGTRAALAVAIAAGLLGPLAIVFANFWLDGREELAAAEQERRGVAYLRPLTGLLGELMAVQAAAVRRAGAETGELRAAITAVDTADQRYGNALKTTERWRALRQRAAALAERPPAKPAAALAAYTEAGVLTVDLAVKVGDTAGLVREPQEDSYYLMDAVVRRLPEVVAGTGYLADAGQVIGAAPSQQDKATLAATHDRVIAASEAAVTDLRRSLESTGQDTLSVTLLGPADAFISAASAMGTTALLPGSDIKANAGEVARLSRSLQSAGAQLQAAGLTELDVALTGRHGEVTGTRESVAAAVLVGLLVAAIAVWFQLPRRDAAAHLGADDDDQVLPEPDDAAGRYASRADTTMEVPEAPELIDARDLLDSAELVRVGRAVRPTRRRHDDDDETSPL